MLQHVPSHSFSCCCPFRHFFCFHVIVWFTLRNGAREKEKPIVTMTNSRAGQNRIFSPTVHVGVRVSVCLNSKYSRVVIGWAKLWFDRVSFLATSSSALRWSLEIHKSNCYVFYNFCSFWASARGCYAINKKVCGDRSIPLGSGAPLKPILCLLIASTYIFLVVAAAALE